MSRSPTSTLTASPSLSPSPSDALPTETLSPTQTNLYPTQSLIPVVPPTENVFCYSVSLVVVSVILFIFLVFESIYVIMKVKSRLKEVEDIRIGIVCDSIG
jgi:hypothetical protein